MLLVERRPRLSVDGGRRIAGYDGRHEAVPIAPHSLDRAGPGSTIADGLAYLLDTALQMPYR
jgi:hypothetical protein